jgi:hypothetical protein
MPNTIARVVREELFPRGKLDRAHATRAAFNLPALVEKVGNLFGALLINLAFTRGGLWLARLVTERQKARLAFIDRPAAKILLWIGASFATWHQPTRAAQRLPQGARADPRGLARRLR